MSWGDGGSKNALIPEIAPPLRTPLEATLTHRREPGSSPSRSYQSHHLHPLSTPASLSVYVEKYSGKQKKYRREKNISQNDSFIKVFVSSLCLLSI